MSKNRFAGTLKPKVADEVVTNIAPLTIELPQVLPKAIGRPKVGKSSNPDYAQATLYLRRSTYKKLKGVALNDEKELSDLAEEIFQNYLNNRKV